jgi:hypothetical protein
MINLKQYMRQRTAKGKVKGKDPSEKAAAFIRSVGPLLTPITVALVGFYGSHFLASQQEKESDLRLYTELISKREEADSSLRKDMFNSIITNFLKPEPTNLSQKVLNLELLTRNFHESLDLAPLFNEVRRQLLKSHGLTQDQRDRLQTRLELVSKEIIGKQISTLAEGGGRLDGAVDFDELEQKPEGITIIDESIRRDQGKDAMNGPQQRKVKVEALRANTTNKEMRIRLEVIGANQKVEADVVYWVGLYNFPMLNNIRLSGGNRCAIAITNFSESSADITFVYFPGSHASLKEKPYYEEVISDLKKHAQQPRPLEVPNNSQP